MNFEVKKIENCFTDSETYEYLLPVTGENMLFYLEGWDVKINRKLRRPTFIAEKNQIIIKCTLDGNIFRISYPFDSMSERREDFERFLRSLSCTE